MEFSETSLPVRTDFEVTEEYLYYLDEALYRIPLKEELNFENKEKVASQIELAGEGQILCYTIDHQQNLYYCTFLSKNMSLTLHKRSAEGKKIYQISAAGLTEWPSSTFPILAADNNENVYLVVNNSIQRYDGEGNLTGELMLDQDLDNSFLTTKTLIEIPDGRILFQIDNSIDGHRQVYQVLEGTMPRLEILEDLTEDMPMSSLCQGLEGLLIQNMDGWLYEYQIDENTWTPLLRWEDSDIYRNEILSIVQLKEDRFLIICHSILSAEKSDHNADRFHPVLLVKTPVEEAPKKEIITLASLFPTIALEEAVVTFNRSSDQYHVTIDTYGATSKFEDNEGAYIRLDSSMTSKSDAPDLLDLTELDVVKYANAGALDDLNDYISRDVNIRKEDFLNNLLEDYTINGKLVSIPKEFNFMGVWITDDRALEAADWTLDSLMEVAGKYDDVRLFPSLWDTPDVMLRVFFSDYMLNKFINRETGQCTMDSDEFCQLLEWVKEQTLQTDNSENSLILPRYLNGFSNYHSALVDAGENKILRGLPSTEGKMAYNVIVKDALGIVSNSCHKDGAWEFLYFFLREAKSSHFTVGQFPTDIAVLNQLAQDISTPEYEESNGVIEKDRDGNPIEKPKQAFFINGKLHRYYAMKKEDAEALLDVINTVDFTPRSALEQSVISIITEEAESFFSGGKTAAQAAEIIQNRVQILISESQ